MWLFHARSGPLIASMTWICIPVTLKEAGELDRALKVKRESPGKSRLKGAFHLESTSLKPSVVGG